MLQKQRLLLTLFLIIFISGCVNGGTVRAGNGISINSFSFNPDEVFNGQATLLSLEIQNLGDMELNDIYVYLYGLNFGESEWAIKSVDKDEDQEVKLIDSSGESLLIYSLLQPFSGVEGEVEKIRWVLTAPKNLPEDITFNQEAGVIVCSAYNTVARCNVEAISENEYLTNQPAQHQITLSQHVGPLRVSVDSMQPLIVTGDSKLTAKIIITNIGGGIATNYDCSDFFADSNLDDLNKVNVDIKLSGSPCSVVDKGVYLRDGKATDFTVRCDVPQATGPKQTYELNIGLGYRYYVEKRAKIKVKGTGEDITAPISPEQPSDPEEPAVSCPDAICNPNDVYNSRTARYYGKNELIEPCSCAADYRTTNAIEGERKWCTPSSCSSRCAYDYREYCQLNHACSNGVCE